MPSGVYKRTKWHIERLKSGHALSKLQIKKCIYCEAKEEDVKFYSRKLRGKIYHSNVCLPCHKDNVSVYYEANRARRMKMSKDWYYANKEYSNKVLTPLSRNRRRGKYNKYMREYKAKNKELKQLKDKRLRLTQIFKISINKNNVTHPWNLGFGKLTKPSFPFLR